MFGGPPCGLSSPWAIPRPTVDWRAEGVSLRTFLHPQIFYGFLDDAHKEKLAKLNDCDCRPRSKIFCRKEWWIGCHDGGTEPGGHSDGPANHAGRRFFRAAAWFLDGAGGQDRGHLKGDRFCKPAEGTRTQPGWSSRGQGGTHSRADALP